MKTTTRLTFAGSLHPATETGFKKLLSEANRVLADGYELFAVVPVGSQIGGVFRNTRPIETEADANSFFE